MLLLRVCLLSARGPGSVATPIDAVNFAVYSPGVAIVCGVVSNVTSGRFVASFFSSFFHGSCSFRSGWAATVMSGFRTSCMRGLLCSGSKRASGA